MVLSVWTNRLARGDEVRIKDGSLKGINGIFDRTMKDKNRVMILLTAINYQASVVVERDLVQLAVVLRSIRN